MRFAHDEDPSRVGAARSANGSVSAVVLAHNRRRAVGVVLDRLGELPVDEVVVVDNGSVDGTAEAISARGERHVRVVDAGGNLGLEGRNIGAREASGEYVVFLDDDSYPLPGAVEALLALFDRVPRLGVAGGGVVDVDNEGRPVTPPDGINTFDWFLRGARTGPVPPDGFPAFFFPEGACMVRREAYLEVGGYVPEFFFSGGEIDVATKLLAAGWDVRYLPGAVFHHMKEPVARIAEHDDFRLRVRNQLWYFHLRMPRDVAFRQALGYLAFDFVQGASQRSLRSWAGGIRDAFRDRGRVRGQRAPIPRSLVKRASERRAYAHRRYLVEKLRRRARRR